MKLWQKNYLAVLSVSFALLFSVCAALLVQQNDHAFQAEKQRVEGAFATARQAVAGAAALYTDGEAALSAMNRALSVTEGLGTDGQFVLFRNGQVCHGTADALPALWVPQTTAGRALFLSTEEGPVFLCGAEENGCTLAGVWAEGTLVQNARRQALIMGGVLLIALVVLACVLFTQSRRMFRPLARLETGARAIADGQYGLRLTGRANAADIQALSDSFNQMAQSVESHVAALEDENARQKQFVRDLSHELKTPMTAMLGYSDLMLADRLTPSERQEGCRYIAQQCRRLNELSQKLMKLSRLDGEEGLPLDDVSLLAAMTAAGDALHPLFREKGVTLRLPAEDAPVQGDGALLCDLFANLMANACKYAPAGSAVVCRLTRTETALEASVTDEGPGAPEEALPLLTRPFYMADKARTRSENGAGIGLSLCARIMTLHGGHMVFFNRHPGFEARAVFPLYLQNEDKTGTAP